MPDMMQPRCATPFGELICVARSEVRRMRPCALTVAMLLSSAVAAEERATDAYLDQTRERWTTLAKKIWDTPETALNEKKSAPIR
jgi:hypothetical protein